ncbi:hypothetical protein FNU3_108 [Fusobacterium phage vB_FnuS_FNU3]|nr:hypothetical protein FNU2_21 [Fusobacterium phage vB_FnuS_FNU2]WGH50360.1 hypothetical protein FNU3_108 [Fusobacterium phage vB_FnuS_FNU3]
MKEKDKIKVICFCSKSGVGKSTIIESFRGNNKFHEVVSNTTRLPRNEFDKTTHIFKAMKDYREDLDSDNVIASYKAPQGYYNWVDYTCFDENKINLFAIDIYACLRLLNNPKFDIRVVYLTCNEVDRLIRLSNRGSNVDDYRDESHLVLDMYAYSQYQDKISIIDTTKREIKDIKEEIVTKTLLDFENFEVIQVNNNILIQRIDSQDLILENDVYEVNFEKILDYILKDYNYLGFIKLATHTENYIEYKEKNYIYYDFALDKPTFLDYTRLVETLLKWKCGVAYDRD